MIFVGNVTTGTHPSYCCFFKNYILVSNTDSNTVSVLDITNNTITRNITVGNKPTGLISNNNYVFVANSSSKTISVIDQTFTVINTISILNNYSPTQLSIDNNYVWGACSRGIIRVSLIDYTITYISHITSGYYPQSVISTGTYVYYGDTNTYTWKLNIATSTKVASIDSGYAGAYSLYIKGNNMYATQLEDSNSLSVIDLTSFTVTNTVYLGDGNIITINMVIGDDNYLYCSGYNQSSVGILFQLDYNLNIINQIVVNGLGSSSMALNNINSLYLTNYFSNTVSIYNIVSEIPPILSENNITTSNTICSCNYKLTYKVTWQPYKTTKGTYSNLSQKQKYAAFIRRSQTNTISKYDNIQFQFHNL